jgi:hypothetical protein
MRPFKYFAALAALLFAASPAFADIALPKPAQPPRNDGEVRRDLPYSQLTIERVEGLREARLQIPRTQLRRISGTAGETADVSGASSGALGRAGTVVGGAFLSLSLILTGLLLARSRRRLAGGRVAAALLGCACAAALAGVAAYANAGPPPGYSPQDPGTLIRAVSGGALSGSVRIEVVEDGAVMKLLIPAKARKGGAEEE